MVIYPIFSAGNLTVYERRRGRQTCVPKYVVYPAREEEFSGGMKQFRRKRAAIRWAEKNGGPSGEGTQAV